MSLIEHARKLRAGAILMIGLAVSPVTQAAISIDSVFFAQTHVQQPNYEYFTLVGNRKTMLKAHVLSSDSADDVPSVKAIVAVGGKRLLLDMSGPATLPKVINSDPCKVEHPIDDAHIAYIPKAWVKPGMTVEIVAGRISKKIENIEVGAPTILNMKMFDVYGFREDDVDFPSGWQEEFEAKLPVSKLNVERIKVVFDEVVLIPRPGVSPAKRVSSRSETFQTEKTASRWMKALKKAAGYAERNNFYYMNVDNMKMSGGRGTKFGAIGFAGKVGYVLHESGHGLSLTHCNQGFYPYKKTTCGVYNNAEHIGTTWPFDIPHKKYVPPISNLKATFRKTPMLGGGLDDEKEGWANTKMKFYSDFEVNKMKKYLEEHMVVWQPEQARYASWNDKEKGYTDFVSNDGVQFPIINDARVVSVLASVSAVTPDANIVYPPIGPYSTGMIRLFDPTVYEDQVAARESYCPEDGCDVSLRVIQGGVRKTYMLPISWDDGADPYSKNSLMTRAINLPADDGAVTKIWMLYTPDAEYDGLPMKRKVVGRWGK